MGTMPGGYPGVPIPVLHLNPEKLEEELESPEEEQEEEKVWDDDDKPWGGI